MVFRRLLLGVGGTVGLNNRKPKKKTKKKENVLFPLFSSCFGPFVPYCVWPTASSTPSKNQLFSAQLNARDLFCFFVLIFIFFFVDVEYEH